LLKDHDFVVIPSLGGFVASLQPARWQNGMLYPPSKMIGFNPTLTYNDGLLAQTIAQHNGCSLEDANTLLKSEVTILQQQLHIWKRISLGNLGYLYQTENGIDFKPYKNSLSISSAYGLTSVYFPVINYTNTATQKAITPTAPINRPLVLPTHRSSRFTAACVAIILLFMMIPVNITNQRQESMAMILPSTVIEEVMTQPETTPEPTIIQTEPCTPYHVVIGSFNTEAKAIKFTKELPSSLANSKIVYSENRFRIVAASFTTEEEGNAGIEQIAQAYPAYKDAWLLHYNP
jgi:hypothetical protein